jgi:hypothetical protein
MHSLTPDPIFKNCQILSFNKSALKDGTAVFSQVFTPDGRSAGFALQPATVYGPRSSDNVAYLVETPYEDSTQVRVWMILDPLGTPKLSWASVPIPNNGGIIDGAPQFGASKGISTVSPLTQGSAFWRDGALWFCHTAGGSFGKAMVFYYRIVCGNYPNELPALGESEAIDGGPGVWTYQPAIGVNRHGDICLVYCQSSDSTFPTIAYTTRTASAARFDTPAILKLSPSFAQSLLFNPVPWGDYAAVSTDPVDDSFWICHEWAKSALPDDWSTWWGNVVLHLPPRFTYAGQGATGFELRLTGSPGATYLLEASSDFQNWTPISTNAAPTGTIEFTDSDAASFEQRFYRAVTK